MAGTDGDGYRSAWRADHVGDAPSGDPWGAPISWPIVPDAEESASNPADSPLLDESPPGESPPRESPPGEAATIAGQPDPSTSEHPTAPWPFVASRSTFPDLSEPPFPPWPGEAGEPASPAVWPPTDLAHESAPGVWSPMPTAWSQQSLPAWPQQTAPPTWPPLPDTTAGERHAFTPDQTATARESPTSTPDSVMPVAAPSHRSPAAEVAPGVYVPGAPSRPAQRSPTTVPVGSDGDTPVAALGDSGGRVRSRGRSVIALVIVIAVVAFGAVAIVIGTRSHGHAKSGARVATGVSAAASAGTSPSTVPSGPTSSGSSADSVPLGDGRALIAKIVPAPAGAHTYDVDDSSAGIMNVGQYVRHYFKSDASEFRRLRQEGFQIAASTDYVRSDGTEIATHLVQFSDSTGAQDYFAVETSGWASDNRVTATFTVPATADAVGYELSKPDALGNRRSVMYEHVGNVVVVINVYTSHKIDQATDTKVMLAQIAALG